VEEQQRIGLLGEREPGLARTSVDGVDLDRAGLRKDISSSTPRADKLQEMSSGRPGRVGA
jgi:hypothetical protein